jgi:hypothetical protein
MAYDIPTRFHKVWSRHLREIERTKMSGRRNNNKKWSKHNVPQTSFLFLFILDSKYASPLLNYISTIWSLDRYLFWSTTSLWDVWHWHD